jgi:hypothetical protein
MTSRNPPAPACPGRETGKGRTESSLLPQADFFLSRGEKMLDLHHECFVNHTLCCRTEGGLRISRCGLSIAHPMPDQVCCGTVISQTERERCTPCPPCEKQNLVQNGPDRRGPPVWRKADTLLPLTSERRQQLPATCLLVFIMGQ